jgi:hypothetical protein
MPSAVPSGIAPKQGKWAVPLRYCAAVREARRKVLVQPFYLQMMRLNVVQAGSE